jgi:hypothetical protein
LRWIKLGRLWIDIFRDSLHFGIGLIAERRGPRTVVTLHLGPWLVKFYR